MRVYVRTMDVRHDQLAGPRGLTFGILSGLVSWALVLALALSLRHHT